MSREMRVLLLVVLTIVVWLGRPAHGQPATPAGNAPGTGAPAAGAQIAQSGTPKGAAACSGCHGAHGEGIPASGFPRLAGQAEPYLARQLAAYADGSRNNPIMSPIAKALTAEQRDAVANYYASLDTPQAKAPSQGSASAKAAGRARALANVGDNRLRVQACGNCHGPDGSGEEPYYPYLAGQNVAYLTAALTAWKDGSRNTDPSGQMSSIGKALDNADIAALAQYYAGQPAPALDRTLAAQRERSTSASRSARTTSGPPGGAEGKQGVGTEQGAATTGGDQGAGGGGAASGGGSTGSSTGNSGAQKK